MLYFYNTSYGTLRLNIVNLISYFNIVINIVMNIIENLKK